MNNITWAVGLGILVLILAGGLFWATQSQRSQVNEEQVQGGGILNTSPAPAIVKTFEVEGRPFEFAPKEIRVNEGDRVRIVFRNTEGFHDWTLSGFNTKTKQINAGETDTIEFIADKKGTFEYFCSVGNHRQMGMVGQFIVE
ncbi:cupredoxin domain-containing protein [Candidatus Daviesbacteria bacterium]|nr:cupredoxin domain-containing protein [Candidatus Daviesbacteria bacterium]